MTFLLSICSFSLICRQCTKIIFYQLSINVFVILLETIIKRIKRTFTVPSMEAYDLSLFIPKTSFYQNIYCTSDYKNKVFNVSKRFSIVDSNKLHDKLILGRNRFSFLIIP